MAIRSVSPFATFFKQFSDVIIQGDRCAALSIYCGTAKGRVFTFFHARLGY